MSPSTDGIGSTTGLSATARWSEGHAPFGSQIARQIASTEICRDEDEVRHHAVLRENTRMVLRDRAVDRVLSHSSAPVRGMPSTSRPIVARAIIAADHDAGNADEVIE
jgi:hypothetical protein